MTKIKIKKAAPEDIAACVKLAHTKELESGPGKFATEKELQSGRRNGILLVAKSEETVIGFVLGYTLSRQSGYVDLLVVDKKYRGQGIGTKLLNAISKRMRNYDITEIWLIAHEMTDDLKFYLNHHFKEGDRFRLFWKTLS